MIAASEVMRFGAFELDPGRFELRRDRIALHLEPQVLNLLIYLARNAHRLVTKDDLVEAVWAGRFISDTAISTQIKAARRAVGDDGRSQKVIRTVHGCGYRFIAPLAGQTAADALPAPSVGDIPPLAEDPLDANRPGIAVLPLQIVPPDATNGYIADALADEMIADLARLRWLVVIARGSTFALRDKSRDPREIGRLLDVQYCLSGVIEVQGDRMAMRLDLARTATGETIWSERYSLGMAELHDVRAEILQNVVANLEMRIARSEAGLARQRIHPRMDAWSAYHLGIDHMYRFNRSDNDRASAYFERAVASQPEFARAFGGLSFTRFQSVFLQYTGDGQKLGEEALQFAERAVRCDPLDAFGYLNLGRAHWLGGGVAESVDLLQQSIALSPSSAQAVYSKAWADMTLDRPDLSDGGATLALRLSPLDPMRYAMLGVKAMSAYLRGDMGEAAEWGERAARSPGAHKHIAIIAALTSRAAGLDERAREWVARARRIEPDPSAAAFLQSFRFPPSDTRERIERELRALGL